MVLPADLAELFFQCLMYLQHQRHFGRLRRMNGMPHRLLNEVVDLSRRTLQNIAGIGRDNQFLVLRQLGPPVEPAVFLTQILNSKISGGLLPVQ